MTMRLIAVSLAAFTVFVVSSLPTDAAMSGCRKDRQCQRGAHCHLGINPNAPGICVMNRPDGPCLRNRDCWPGYHCAGILVPRKPGVCVKGA
jgi:hypothetical protein